MHLMWCIWCCQRKKKHSTLFIFLSFYKQSLRNVQYIHGYQKIFSDLDQQQGHLQILLCRCRNPRNPALPAEEIWRGASSINLCYILSIVLNFINSEQLFWSLSNPITWGGAQGRGCWAEHFAAQRKFVPHTPIFIKPCLVVFIF